MIRNNLTYRTVRILENKYFQLCGLVSLSPQQSPCCSHLTPEFFHWGQLMISQLVLLLAAPAAIKNDFIKKKRMASSHWWYSSEHRYLPRMTVIQVEDLIDQLIPACWGSPTFCGLDSSLKEATTCQSHTLASRLCPGNVTQPAVLGWLWQLYEFWLLFP